VRYEHIRIENQHPWLILACAWIMGFGMYAPMFSVPPIIDIVTEEFNINNTQAGLIFSVPLMITAAIAIPAGALADRIGIRKVAGVGMLVVILGSLLRGYSVDFATLLAFTCIYGTGFALIFPNLPKLVAAWFPQERNGLATGIYSSGIISGLALPLAITMPAVLPVTDSPQGVFIIWTIPAVVAAIVWWIVVRDPRQNSDKIKTETIINYRIWTNKGLWLASVLFLLSSFAAYTWAGWTTDLMESKGATTSLAALMTSIVFWMNLPAVLLAPWLSDRIGLRKPFLWGSFAILALASLGALFHSLSLGWIVVIAVGLTIGTQFALLLTLPTELVPREAVGKASGMLISIGQVGGLLGPIIGGYVIDKTGNLNAQIIILIGLTVAATFLSFKLPETGSKPRKEPTYHH
jgi:CP family cyanate transporter-like MFS transporter